MALRHLVPPKIASPAALGQASTAQRMTRVVDFYKSLPKGAAPRATSLSANPIKAYRQKYFGQNGASGAPIVHAIVVLFLIGYTFDYNKHLKFHKNNHH